MALDGCGCGSNGFYVTLNGGTVLYLDPSPQRNMGGKCSCTFQIQLFLCSCLRTREEFLALPSLRAYMDASSVPTPFIYGGGIYQKPTPCPYCGANPSNS